MKRFIDWLKSDSPPQFAANDAKRASVDARFKSDKKTKGEYSDACSVGWIGTDQADSSFPGTGSLNFDGTEATEPMPRSATDETCGLSSDTDVDMGFDPYGSGRFSNAKKR